MMNDWLPIDEVTPENCPDGSTVMISIYEPLHDVYSLWDATARWRDGELQFFDIGGRFYGTESVMVCTK
jgi:hypothetical protein